MGTHRNTMKFLAGSGMAMLVFLAGSAASAAPGTLADVPLFLSASTAPNIMFLIDNSGSMNNVVPDDPYDSSVTYVSCPSGQMLTPGYQVDIRITSSGNPYFRYAGSYYDWGTGGGTGLTGRNKRCFDPAATYKARLYANGGSNPRYPSGYLNGVYSGNYLNWYFGCTGADASTCGTKAVNFGLGAKIKPTQQRRMDIAKTAATDLVNSLNNVRVGLAAYNGSNGAYIHVGVDDIATNKSTMISKINALTPSGSTPLAESLANIGRYFVGEATPQYDGMLTLHPGQANETSADDDSVFPDGPAYASGISKGSPIQYFCQKSFAVLLTDGRPQSDRDTSIVSSYLRDYDGDCTDLSKDDGHTPSATACTDSTYDLKNSPHDYESYGSDWLDDVAKALYEMDLRPDLKDFSGNPVKNNIVTYAIGFADDQVINDPLLKDTAKNGGGLFLTASNASSLKSAFESAIQSVLSQVGAAAAVAFNSGSLTSNSVLYLARFDSTRWSGDLIAYKINLDGTVDTSSPLWSAASELDIKTPGARVIITYDRDTATAKPFRVPGNLSADQQSDLSTSPSGGTDPYDQERLDYLRGVRGNEGSLFRTRTNRLGDIVHSSPVYVGKPALAWPDTSPFPTASGQRYSDFKSGPAASRKKVVYVGANDGMLHGFDANTGEEVLAYVPHEIASSIADRGLHYLTDPNYQHKYYVDLPSTVSDVYYGSAWHTVLVGGLRGGGRGLFALDITDPSAFSESNASSIFMWEFTDDDDSDLGYTFSKPTIAMMNNGKFAVIVGNGYNSTGSGEAVLYILFVDGGLDGTWTAGTDYIKISTKTGTAADPNGLSTPAVADLDGDGTADRIYAGDLNGNMWVFDVSSSNKNAWDVAYKTGATPKPLFTAKDAGGTVQPITSKPFLLRNPDVATSLLTEPNILVLFGTGQYLTDADKTNTDTQTFYAVWDSGKHSLTRSDLVEQTITEFDVNVSGMTKTVRTLSSNTVDYSGGTPDYGWYVDLLKNGSTQEGERVVTSPVVLGSLVFFNTLIPDTTPCAYGGTGWLMSADASTGSNPTEAAFDLNADGIVTSADFVTPPGGTSKAAAGERFGKGIPMESRFLADNQYTTSSTGEVVQRKIKATGVSNTGRLSWRQLCRTTDQEC